MLLHLILQAAVAGASPSGAVIPAAPSPAPAPQEIATVLSSTQPSNQVICRNEAISGSRIGAFHVCMTKADWDARGQQSGDYTTAIQLNSMMFTPH